MRSLLATFVALSLFLGPLEGVWAGASAPAPTAAAKSANASTTDAPATVADETDENNQNSSQLTAAETALLANSDSRKRLEKVLLRAVLNRTRLFENINSSLMNSLAECFIPEHDHYVQQAIMSPMGDVYGSEQVEQTHLKINPDGDCPKAVANALENVKLNFPDLRTMFTVYNLLRHTREFLPALGATENLGLGGNMPYVYKDISFFTNPIEGSLLDTKLTNILDIEPSEADIQNAAALTSSDMYITMPCAKSANFCPTSYNFSFSGYMQRYCHDYIDVHKNDSRLSPWPAVHPEAICDDFHLVYNRNNKQFTWVLPHPKRNANGSVIHDSAEQALYIDVIDALYKNIGDMLENSRQAMIRLIQQTPYVILVKSENPSIDEIGQAILNVAAKAQSNTDDFENEFNALKADVSNRYRVLKVLDRKPVVDNVMKYWSKDMVDESVTPRVFANVLNKLMATRTFEKFEVGVVQMGLGIGFGVACFAMTKNLVLAPLSSWCGMALTLALTTYSIWDSWTDYNLVFSELFGSSSVGADDGDKIDREKLAYIDDTIKDKSFILQDRVLQDLESLDSAHSSVLWSWAFSLTGYGLGRYAKTVIKGATNFLVDSAGIKAETVEYVGRFRQPIRDLRDKPKPFKFQQR